MTLNIAIEKAILSQLRDVFPESIGSPQDILPAHSDRAEIMDYLFDFYENRWVTFINLKSKDGKDCSDIKITRLGIAHLDHL